MQYRTLTQTQYEDARFDFFKQFEGAHPEPYLDTKSIPSIGIGMNLRTPENQAYMRNYFGFDLGNTDDLSYWGRIVIELSAQQPSGSALQTSLDAIMNERAQHFGYGSPTFSFASEPDIKTAYKVSVATEEARTNSYYASSGVPEYSMEKLVLLSLKFQGIVAPATRTFLANGDRAEAWAEVRYFSNDDGKHPKRRYAEAAVFGLYRDAAATEEEAENAARMFQRRRVDIEQYESNYSQWISEANLDLQRAGAASAYEVHALPAELDPAKQFFAGSVTAEATAYSTEIATAFAAISSTELFVGKRNELNSINSGVNASTGQARTSNDLIVGQDLMDNLSGGDGNDVLTGRAGDDYLFGQGGNDILLGGQDDDRIYGGDGIDLLIGGAGADTLEGGSEADTLDGRDGQGGDILRGGAGYDTYYADAGDTIIDSDGVGEIWLGGVKLSGGSREQNDDYYVSADRSTIYQENPNGSIDAWVKSPDGTVDHARIEPPGQPDPGQPDPGPGPGNGPGGPRNGPGPGSGGGGGGGSTGDGGSNTGQPGMGLPLRTNPSPDPPKDPPFTPPYQDAGNSVCPLIFDLDGGGTQVTSVAEGVYFDHDGNSFAERTGWVSGNDGLLVLDKNGDSQITTGNELFGNRTVLPGGQLAENGFLALAEVDSNHDGQVNSSDAAWSSLKIWVDTNHNGISVASELHSLAEFDIQSISTVYVEGEEEEGLEGLGSYTRDDGSQAAIEDRDLPTQFTNTQVGSWVATTPEIDALPDLKGYGNVYDLHQAMARDTSGELTELVRQFSTANNVAARMEILNEILFKWTDSDGIDPHSRDNPAWNTAFDARMLATLEKFNGVPFFQPFSETGPDANPIAEAVPRLELAYSNLQGLMYSQLMAQTGLKWLYEQAPLSWDADSQSVKADQSAVIAALGNLLATDRKSGIATTVDYARLLLFSLSPETLNADSFITAMGNLGADVSVALNELLARSVPGISELGDDNDNVMVGTIGADFFGGRPGNDTLQGGFGDDALNGEDGDDILDGGPGRVASRNFVTGCLISEVTNQA